MLRIVRHYPTTNCGSAALGVRADAELGQRVQVLARGDRAVDAQRLGVAQGLGEAVAAGVARRVGGGERRRLAVVAAVVDLTDPGAGADVADHAVVARLVEQVRLAGGGDGCVGAQGWSRSGWWCTRWWTLW
jgi:hypothetical protein